jgi:hypothetical protein
MDSVLRGCCGSVCVGYNQDSVEWDARKAKAKAVWCMGTGSREAWGHTHDPAYMMSNSEQHAVTWPRKAPNPAIQDCLLPLGPEWRDSRQRSSRQQQQQQEGERRGRQETGDSRRRRHRGRGRPQCSALCTYHIAAQSHCRAQSARSAGAQRRPGLYLGLPSGL